MKYKINHVLNGDVYLYMVLFTLDTHKIDRSYLIIDGVLKMKRYNSKLFTIGGLD